MRLIDVDTFTEENAMRWKASGGSEDYYYSVNYLLTRDSVEAIPIEWMKRLERIFTEKAYSVVKDIIWLWEDEFCEKKWGEIENLLMEAMQ